VLRGQWNVDLPHFADRADRERVPWLFDQDLETGVFR
jgi:hypothetical protein